MKRSSCAIGVFFVAMTTLVLELTLIRVFDVLWYANIAYMVISLAMFSFGLAGVYTSIRPSQESNEVPVSVPFLAVALGLASVLILPVLNSFPLDFNSFNEFPLRTSLSFGAIYCAIAFPFFVAGVILSRLFSSYAKDIQRLYFWDLVGAALGCIIIVPLLPRIEGTGMLFVACGFGFFAAALFSNIRTLKVITLVLGAASIVFPFIAPGTFDFKPHANKRGFIAFSNEGRLEKSYWDPISKIDIFNFGNSKWIAYDGGTQSSYYYKFDGDFDALRANLPGDAHKHFWGRMVIASHFIKQNTNQEVLVIGAAGGQETKPALTFGASHVDAIELVSAVVTMGKTKYDNYIGGLYNHPNVNARRGEGRSFLRASDKRYDIIQMMSNHTSSSIGAGNGAMRATYLQTVEAYKEYFEHLKKDGILHINHHIYPRMVATAAAAWKQLGRTDFRKHIAVFEMHGHVDNLPTMLIKMTPWEQEEIKTLQGLFNRMAFPVNPLAPEDGFLSDDFFSGDFPQELADSIPFRVAPTTDDKPYFNFLRKKIAVVDEDANNYLNLSTTGLLNSQMNNGVPMDIVHLFITSAAAIIFCVLFIFIPLLFSDTGRSQWNRKGSFLCYFACLGAGFIVFELIFIQVFMKLIGYPLYTYSTILFVFLFGAGIGSLLSEKLGITTGKRWRIPFLGVVVTAVAILLCYPAVFDIFLEAHILIRALVAAIMIFPLAFFLGMPFPIGILEIENQGRGAIAWAWAFNGLFTMAGSIASVLISIYFGFTVSILAAISIYALAFVMLKRIKSAERTSTLLRSVVGASIKTAARV